MSSEDQFEFSYKAKKITNYLMKLRSVYPQDANLLVIQIDTMTIIFLRLDQTFVIQFFRVRTGKKWKKRREIRGSGRRQRDMTKLLSFSFHIYIFLAKCYFSFHIMCSKFQITIFSYTSDQKYRSLSFQTKKPLHFKTEKYNLKCHTRSL